MTITPEPFSGHSGAVCAIAVLPDGRRIVTGGEDETIRLWNLRTGRQLSSHREHRDPVLAVATTDDHRVLSWGRGRKVVWDIADNTTSTELHRASVKRAAISPDGGTVAAIGHGGDILRPEDGTARPSGHQQVDSIAVTAQGVIITAGRGPAVRVVDSSGAELGRVEGHAIDKIGVACSADGTRVAYVTSDGVWCWNRARIGRQPARLTGSADVVSALAVTPDGKQVVAGGSRGGIWAWDPNRPHDPIRMHGHGSRVRSFAVTPDQLRLVSGAEDGTIRVWDLTTGAEVTPETTPPPLPAIAGDQESSRDLLGFREDVESLAALITDRATEQPLAVALLGRWGSGKSSFMRQLQDSVARLADQGSQIAARSVFATAVHQVRFDAWHFNDDHLWVGMVEHLFAGLAEPVPPDAEEVRAEREALQEKLRDLLVLDDPNAGATRRLRARLRLWVTGLAPWRGRIALAGAAVLLLGVVTGVTGLAWLLSANAVVTAVIAVVTTVLGSPVVGWLVSTWRAIREFAGRRALERPKDVRDTRVRLARLDAAERLALVIEEARSGGFDQYRGLLGRVHADLRRLSDSAREAFAEWGDGGSVGPPPLERVILYIDDLDRCSPRKVVDVLAAVHLLLALPLFVVVVAVDPRWLRRCLEQYHSELFGGADGTDAGTPLDYLDKIFQVVFALRPMGDAAKGFIEDLVPTDDPLPGESDGATPSAQPPDPTPSPAPNPPSEGSRTPEPDPPPDPAAPPQPEQLRLRAVELEFIVRLRALLETPRAVKRFVNLYRLVRAPIVDEKLEGFIGPDGRGEYQAVLVLLAVLVAAPESCRALIGALEPDREGGMADLMEELASVDQSPQAGDVWTRLLTVMREGDPVHDSLTTYREWAGTIARFSFETWDLTTPR
jgi:hypothetical protein